MLTRNCVFEVANALIWSVVTVINSVVWKLSLCEFNVRLRWVFWLIQFYSVCKLKFSKMFKHVENSIKRYQVGKVKRMFIHKYLKWYRKFSTTGLSKIVSKSQNLYLLHPVQPSYLYQMQ